MMPVYSALFGFFTMANIALPGTSSFVGEFLLLVGLFKENILICLFATLGVILCGSYSLWLYNRICFGNLNTINILYYRDIDLKEFAIMLPLLIVVILFGFFPGPLIYYLNFVCNNYLIVSLS